MTVLSGADSLKPRIGHKKRVNIGGCGCVQEKLVTDKLGCEKNTSIFLEGQKKRKVKGIVPEEKKSIFSVGLNTSTLNRRKCKPWWLTFSVGRLLSIRALYLVLTATRFIFLVLIEHRYDFPNECWKCHGEGIEQRKF